MIHLLVAALLSLTSLLGQPWAGGRPTQVACKSQSGHISVIMVPSSAYSRPVAVSVYFPPCYEEEQESPSPDQTPYPVIYLLHGAQSTETQWPDLNVQAAADELIKHGAPPFVVVMPGASYFNATNYGVFVINDLLPHMEERYHVANTPAQRAIGGLSLGGYWALRIAFLHPTQFAAVGGYSPVVDLGAANDPLPLARYGDVSPLQQLSVFLDVGNHDALLNGTIALSQALTARGLTVAFSTGEGGHTRAYWRSNTITYLNALLSVIDPHPVGG